MAVAERNWWDGHDATEDTIVREHVNLKRKLKNGGYLTFSCTDNHPQDIEVQDMITQHGSAQFQTSALCVHACVA